MASNFNRRAVQLKVPDQEDLRRVYTSAISSFSGIQNTKAPVEMAPGSLRDATNVYVDDDYRLVTRKRLSPLLFNNLTVVQSVVVGETVYGITLSSGVYSLHKLYPTLERVDFSKLTTQSKLFKVDRRIYITNCTVEGNSNIFALYVFDGVTVNAITDNAYVPIVYTDSAGHAITVNTNGETSEPLNMFSTNFRNGEYFRFTTDIPTTYKDLRNKSQNYVSFSATSVPENLEEGGSHGVSELPEQGNFSDSVPKQFTARATLVNNVLSVFLKDFSSSPTIEYNITANLTTLLAGTSYARVTETFRLHTLLRYNITQTGDVYDHKITYLTTVGVFEVLATTYLGVVSNVSVTAEYIPAGPAIADPFGTFYAPIHTFCGSSLYPKREYFYYVDLSYKPPVGTTVPPQFTVSLVAIKANYTTNVYTVLDERLMYANGPETGQVYAAGDELLTDAKLLCYYASSPGAAAFAQMNDVSIDSVIIIKSDGQSYTFAPLSSRDIYEHISTVSVVNNSRSAGYDPTDAKLYMIKCNSLTKDVLIIRLSNSITDISLAASSDLKYVSSAYAELENIKPIVVEFDAFSAKMELYCNEISATEYVRIVRFADSFVYVRYATTPVEGSTYYISALVSAPFTLQRQINRYYIQPATPSTPSTNKIKKYAYMDGSFQLAIGVTELYGSAGVDGTATADSTQLITPAIGTDLYNAWTEARSNIAPIDGVYTMNNMVVYTSNGSCIYSTTFDIAWADVYNLEQLHDKNDKFVDVFAVSPTAAIIISEQGTFWLVGSGEGKLTAIKPVVSQFEIRGRKAGSFARRALDDAITLMSDDGIMMFTGSSEVTETAKNIENMSSACFLKYDEFLRDEVSRFTYRDQWFNIYAIVTNAQTKFMLYDARSSAWWYWDLPITASNIFRVGDNLCIITKAGCVYELTDSDLLTEIPGSVRYNDVIYDVNGATTQVKVAWFVQSHPMSLGNITRNKSMKDIVVSLYPNEEIKNFKLFLDFEIYTRNFIDGRPYFSNETIRELKTLYLRTYIPKFQYISYRLFSAAANDVYERLVLSSLSFAYRVLNKLN